MKKEDLYKQYAVDENLKTYHYKVLFLLMGKNQTQSEICSELGISKQNLNKICKDLISIGYLSYAEVAGRNKYLKINTNLNTQVMGQMALKDI